MFCAILVDQLFCGVLSKQKGNYFLSECLFLSCVVHPSCSHRFLYIQCAPELFFIIMTNAQAFFSIKESFSSTGREEDISWIKFSVVHHSQICDAKPFFFANINQYSIVFLAVNLTCPVIFCVFCLY